MTFSQAGPVGEAVGTECVARFLLNAKGKHLAAMWHGFQDAGAGSPYDCGYFTADSIREANRSGWAIKDYEQLVDFERLTMTLQTSTVLI